MRRRRKCSNRCRRAEVLDVHVHVASALLCARSPPAPDIRPMGRMLSEPRTARGWVCGPPPLRR